MLGGWGGGGGGKRCWDRGRKVSPGVNVDKITIISRSISTLMAAALEYFWQYMGPIYAWKGFMHSPDALYI